MRRRVFKASLGVVLLLSGCALGDGDDTSEGAVDVGAEVRANDGMDANTSKLSDQAMDERTGEAQQALTKWEACYKITYTVSKAACTKSHLPADFCHHFADGAATAACRPLIGVSAEEVE